MAGYRRIKSRAWSREHGRAERAPCRWCQRPMTFEEATVDHEPPLSEGGRRCDVVLACYDCNQMRNRRLQVLHAADRAAARILMAIVSGAVLPDRLAHVAEAVRKDGRPVGIELCREMYIRYR